MEKREYVVELDDKSIQAFKEELNQLDGMDIHKKFLEYHKWVNKVLDHLLVAKDIIYEQLASEKNLNKYKEITIISELSFLLIKSTRAIVKTLQKYITFSNTLYKPMLTLGLDKGFYFETEAATELEEDINELLEYIKPTYNYLNHKVKTNYKELDKKSKELEDKRKVIKLKSKKLNKFITKVDKNSDYVKVYLNLVKVSNKIPVSTSLAAASGDNGISKSSWDRILKKTAYLRIIRDEMEKIIKRTKNSKKLEFYKTVFSNIDERYNNNLLNEFEAKRIENKTPIDSEDSDFKPIAEYLQDKEEFDDYFKKDN